MHAPVVGGPNDVDRVLAGARDVVFAAVREAQPGPLRILAVRIPNCPLENEDFLATLMDVDGVCRIGRKPN